MTQDHNMLLVVFIAFFVFFPPYFSVSYFWDPNLMVLLIHPNLFCAAVQKRGYVDLLELAREDNLSCNYGFTLPKDPACNLLCSWTAADPSTFLIRGETYLEDRKKVFFNIVVLMLLNYFI